MIDPLTLDQMRVLVAVAGTEFLCCLTQARPGAVGGEPSRPRDGGDVGVALFDRSTKTPTLTEAGAAIVPDAGAIVDSARALRARPEHR